MAETARMNTRPATVVEEEMGLRPGMRATIELASQNKLKTRLNCSNKFFGRNVSGVYLVVRIKFPRKCCALLEPWASCT